MKTLLLTSLLLTSLLLTACAQQPTSTAARHDTRGNHIGISNESGDTELYGSIGIRAKASK